MKVLLTGATGFIGSKLLENDKYEFIKVVRNRALKDGNVFIYAIDGDTNWSEGVYQADVVIHLAGVAHNKLDSQNDYKSVNYQGSINLANQAANAGVKRFIFLSSIAVNGISNTYPFKYSDKTNAADGYAASKYEAEEGLKEIAENTGLEVVIIRPPLVYGKNAPGNFRTLLKLAEANFFLPLGAVNNSRSFVSVDNLVDLIITCIEHPSAANQTFLVSDDEDISSSNLLNKLIVFAGKTPSLLPVPVFFLELVASMFGKNQVLERFTSSLTIDIEYTKETLNWKPPISLDEGIRRCIR